MRYADQPVTIVRMKRTEMLCGGVKIGMEGGCPRVGRGSGY